MDNPANLKRREQNKQRDIFWRILAVILALAIWQVLSACIHQSILLVSPLQVGRRILTIWREPGFWGTIWFSLIRILAGFFIGLAGGVLLGTAAASRRAVEILLEPWIAAAKTVPVAAIIVILLIWVRSRNLSVIIAALVVLPLVYQNVLTGCRSANPLMKEMAGVFRFSRIERIQMITFPSVRPYLYAAVRTSAGMAWKAGIAAEILGTPAGSVGRQMYLSKTILDTESLLAWTVIVSVASLICEKIFLLIFQKAADCFFLSEKITGRKQKKAGTGNDKEKTPVPPIRVFQLNKSYGAKKVLKDFSASFLAGMLHVVRGPSGVGKTTLLRLIMGLEQPEEGTIEGVPSRISAVFQEDRLCEEMTAVRNVLVGIAADAGKETAQEHLKSVGLGDSMNQPVSSFSGGMKRRTAVVRACLAKSDLLVLDEPFTGLDSESKELLKDYIRRQAEGRIVLLAAHDQTAFDWMPHGENGEHAEEGNSEQDRVQIIELEHTEE